MLYENLANEFATLIGDGQMRPGDRLPSVRHLALQRKLSISTVVQALRTLESRGMVEARPQSGYYVRRRPARMVEPLAPTPKPEPVDVGVNRRLMAVLRSNEAPGMVPFGSALPAPELMLAPRLSRLYASIARRKPQLLASSSHSGLSEVPLLRAITRRALEWGCPLTANEVVVTNSCTEALMLCLRAVTKPGDTVAVESPTYYVMLQLLEAMGLRALEIPTHPVTGVSVDALELATRKPAAAGGVAACLFDPQWRQPAGQPDAGHGEGTPCDPAGGEGRTADRGRHLRRHLLFGRTATTDTRLRQEWQHNVVHLVLENRQPRPARGLRRGRTAHRGHRAAEDIDQR